MKRLMAVMAVAAAIGSNGGCGGGGGTPAGRSDAEWLDLEIVRPEVEIEKVAEPEVVKTPDGDELIIASLIVPPSWLNSAPGGAGAAAAPDPFAAPSAEEPARWNTAKEVLEAFGVRFGPGAWARYQLENSTLFVCQTREQMDLIEAVCQSLGVGPEAYTTINVRLEIYEVSPENARQLERSASEHFENTPELNAVIDLVKRGKAGIVDLVGLKCRSGQRAGYESGVEFRYLAEFDWIGEGENRRVMPIYKSRLVGTVLEVDPICGPTDILDVHLKLEHHAGPPRMEARKLAMPGGKGNGTVEIPVFSFHRIDTTETMMDGTVKLLGSWSPGGVEPDVRRLIAFLRTDLQPLMGTDLAGAAR